MRRRCRGSRSPWRPCKSCARDSDPGAAAASARRRTTAPGAGRPRHETPSPTKHALASLALHGQAPLHTAGGALLRRQPEGAPPGSRPDRRDAHDLRHLLDGCPDGHLLHGRAYTSAGQPGCMRSWSSGSSPLLTVGGPQRLGRSTGPSTASAEWAARAECCREALVAESAADDVLGLRPLLPLAAVEGHVLALGELAVPAALDLGGGSALASSAVGAASSVISCCQVLWQVERVLRVQGSKARARWVVRQAGLLDLTDPA